MKYIGLFDGKEDIVTKEKLETKQDEITGAATTITDDNLTASHALVSDANGKVAVSTVTSTELGYLDGVTSNVQTQLNKKLESVPVTSVNGKTGAVTLGKSDVGLGSVDNVRQYSASNPPPYPVTSVNGATGAVTLSASDVGAQPTITVNGILKGDGAGGIGAAVPGTDYLAESDVVYCYITRKASGHGFVSSMTTAQIYEATKSRKLVYAVDEARIYHVVFANQSRVQFTAAMMGGGIFGYLITETTIKQVTVYLQDTSDMVTSVSAESTDTQYPSAKAVWDALIERVPSVTAADNGKFLRVVNGAWAAVEIANANGGSF